MLEISFLFGELLLAAVWLLARGVLALRRGAVDWRREALLLVMYVNLAVILRFTFYPLETVNGRVQPLLFDPGKLWPPRLNLVPVARLFEYASRQNMLKNVLGNVALFIPSGIVLPLLCRRVNTFGRTVAAGAGLSLGIEIVQLAFPVRASDVDDLICNVLGCAVGYGMYALARRAKRET